LYIFATLVIFCQAVDPKNVRSRTKKLITIIMKKVYMMLAVCAIALASCKKEYTCECSYTDSTDPSFNSTVSYTFEAKKSEAETVCGDYSVTAGGTGWSCKLK